jgi:glycosyltransferase involved in cell wall biosynthesis
MPSNSKIAVVIIVYNTAKLITLQIELLRRFSLDPIDIIVIDNSSEKKTSEDIFYFSRLSGVKYMKTNASDSNGSDSHVFACNVSYLKIKSYYDYFFYLDHDNFPVKDFSIPTILKDKCIGGLLQAKSKPYFWAGCVMWNNKEVDNSLINFGVSHELGLDTGGMLYKVIETYGEDRCVFFDEQYSQNPYFNTGMYNFYAMINDGMFMHFINASEWNPAERNEERINSLINILNEKTKI